MTVRNDRVYLITTVGKRVNSYELRRKQPKTLAPNQFAYAIFINLEMVDWFDRIQEVHPPPVVPPRLPKPAVIQMVAKDFPELLLDRIAGRDSELVQKIV